MKIALVTNKKLHHKYWATSIYKKNPELVSLIIIIDKKSSFIESFKSKKLNYFGFTYFLLKTLSLIYNFICSSSISRKLHRAEKKYFSKYENLFNEIPKSIIFYKSSINSKSSIELIKNNRIECLFFLGGDLARAEVINSVKLCVNFHSGISPIYNGNKTTFHAVSDYRPNFCGGTLMIMNERIDGGDILMHFLTSINNDDRAEDLFMKGIIGSVSLFQRFIDNDFDHKGCVKQKKSFRFFNNLDWNIVNDIRLNQFDSSKRIKFYNRKEIILDYSGKNFDLKTVYSEIISNIIG